MLKIFRHKNVAKVVLWGILILILPAFVLWGTGSSGRDKVKGPTFVGYIGNEKITFKDFADSLTAIRTQIILNYYNQPKVLDTLLASKAFLGKLAWDRLLMARQAKKAHVRVSDKEIVSFVRSHPIFSRNGAFDDKIYLYVLRNNMGLDPRAFEEIARENIAIQHLNDQVTKDVKITDDEVTQAYRADNEKFKISYTLFSADDFLDKVKVDPAKVKEYYEAHKDELIVPAKKRADNKALQETVAAFDDIKGEIEKFLKEDDAREAAIKSASETETKIKDLMAKENLSFEAAAAKLGLKVQESAFFAMPEYLEGIGDANRIVEVAAKLKKDGVSGAVEVKKGAIIFRLADTQKFDEEKFKKEKPDYSKRALEIKKTIYLENWLRGLERDNKLNIDFKDYEKYYR